MNMTLRIDFLRVHTQKITFVDKFQTVYNQMRIDTRTRKCQERRKYQERVNNHVIT